MAILVDENTVLLIQGITGKQGQIHCVRQLESGTKIAAGVAPGKGGQNVETVPVFNTVAEAIAEHPEINTTMIITPKQFVLDSALEAIEAKIPLIIIITEWVPVHDTLTVVVRARQAGLSVVGPNTIGVISPGKAKVGVMPSYIYSRGHIAIVSRSGTLTHEAASNLTFSGYGQSSCIGIGGDAIIGLNHAEALALLAEDDETDAIVLIGEIGGASEETAAAYIRASGLKKPVAAFIVGVNAPQNTRMGHAGAIVNSFTGTVKSKIESLSETGVKICYTMRQVIEFAAECDARLGGRLSTVDPVYDRNLSGQGELTCLD